jgi:hypothetical protein
MEERGEAERSESEQGRCDPVDAKVAARPVVAAGEEIRQRVRRLQQIHEACDHQGHPAGDDDRDQRSLAEQGHRPARCRCHRGGLTHSPGESSVPFGRWTAS